MISKPDLTYSTPPPGPADEKCKKIAGRVPWPAASGWARVPDGSLTAVFLQSEKHQSGRQSMGDTGLRVPSPELPQQSSGSAGTRPWLLADPNVDSPTNSPFYFRDTVRRPLRPPAPWPVRFPGLNDGPQNHGCASARRTRKSGHRGRYRPPRPAAAGVQVGANVFFLFVNHDEVVDLSGSTARTSGRRSLTQPSSGSAGVHAPCTGRGSAALAARYSGPCETSGRKNPAGVTPPSVFNSVSTTAAAQTVIRPTARQSHGATTCRLTAGRRSVRRMQWSTCPTRPSLLPPPPSVSWSAPGGHLTATFGLATGPTFRAAKRKLRTTRCLSLVSNKMWLHALLPSAPENHNPAPVNARTTCPPPPPGVKNSAPPRWTTRPGHHAVPCTISERQDYPPSNTQHPRRTTKSLESPS